MVPKEQNFFSDPNQDEKDLELNFSNSRNVGRDAKMKPKNMLAYFLDE